METFSALLVICAGNSLVTGEFLAQMPLTRSFGVFSNLRLDRQLSKLWGRWWFETPSNPSWRHRNDTWRIPDMTNITEKGSSKVQVITVFFFYSVPSRFMYQYWVIFIRCPSYQYKDFRYKNKTVQPQPYLYNWNRIPRKMKRGPGSLKMLSIRPIDVVST